MAGYNSDWLAGLMRQLNPFSIYTGKELNDRFGETGYGRLFDDAKSYSPSLSLNSANDNWSPSAWQVQQGTPVPVVTQSGGASTGYADATGAVLDPRNVDAQGRYGNHLTLRGQFESTNAFQTLVDEERERIRQRRLPEQAQEMMAKRAKALGRGLDNYRRGSSQGIFSGASGRSGTILTSPLGVPGGLSGRGQGLGGGTTLLGG